jgi:oxaloacetate decarboxylase beta subunit
MDKLLELWLASGIYNISFGQALMMVIGLVLLYLAIRKNFEPLLLVPIGFGGILANIPEAGLAFSAVENAIHFAKPEVLSALAGALGVEGTDPHAILQGYKVASHSVHTAATDIALDAGYNNGMLYNFYLVAIASGAAPLIIFMGVGAMTDFGPLLANPKTLFLGAAAQFGIFATVLGAVGLSMTGVMDFSIQDAAAIGIIGGADGPTAIYVASLLSPHLLGAIAVAAYSYMALVPMIQPPIMRALTSEAERKIKMHQLRPVSKTEKILFPILVTILVSLIVPPAGTLVGMLMLGNVFKESGVVARLEDTAKNALINIITIFLGLTVGATATASEFLKIETIVIIALGIVAFSIGTAAGLLLAKVMNKLSGGKINPLIGSAGVSAVPMAARVSQVVGQKENPSNFLLMHAMGPNVAGVIGSAVSAGVLLSLFG